LLRNETRNIKIVRLMFFFLGLLTIAVGLYATESGLVQFALHFSSDKALDERTIAFLHGLRIKMILLGVGLVLLSMLVGFFVLLNDYIMKKIESEHLIERYAFTEGCSSCELPSPAYATTGGWECGAVQ
jgi:hypothetical protein